MLGLILIYWLGKKFYTLAEDFDKSKWGYAILGVVVYYSGIIAFAVIAAVFVEIVSSGYLDTMNERLFDLACLPFGLLSSYLLFKYLEKTWKKEDPRNNNSIDEIGRSQEKLEA